MKKFTKAEIDGTRTYFQSQGFKEEEVHLGKRVFTYFIIPQDKEPALPNFVVRLTGDSDNNYVLGISDAVDPKHRKYAVAHELIEFTEIGIDTPHRCEKALEQELQLIPDEIRSDYILMRRNFFRNLIPYCAEQPQFYTEQDLAQFKHNLERLEKLVQKLP